MKDQPIYRVAIYARVSTNKKDNDPKRQETENQLRVLREYCQLRDWPIIDEYVDRESGRKADRPEFIRLFDDAHQGKFDLVLFWSLDRFSREGVLETLNHLRRLDGYGVRFLSHTEQYLDSAGMFREAIISILATLAKQEAIRQSERVKAGIERARGQGKPHGRPALSQATIDQIKTLRDTEELSMPKIAKRLGISVGSVAKALKMKS